MSEKKGMIWKYVVITYLVFWVMVLGIGAVASIVLNASDLTMRFVIALCSWSPTIVLLVMFKKLNPGMTIKKFYKNAFKKKINIQLLIMITVVMAGLFILAALLVAIVTGTELSMQIEFLPALLFGNLFFTIIQGATGEESGWRGYLLPKMETKYGFLRGNIYLGLVWGFWHLPLWFITGEFSGIDLVTYIVVFLTLILSFSIIIGVVMKKCNNLFIAFWMHFLFNFTVTFFIGQVLELLISLLVLYVVTAVISVMIHLKKNKSLESNIDSV
ncbi:hypothetical protein KQ51_00608 [Candidatus Izimaplasma bacterium HR1]|jgi:membrane protease YdiL (CAAX protease family)|uniref:CPBP family intramembrane glutamic endopeptidase n=1 Tax=Candidatus Izimoplasma sp. HR1 TaxID=1541959 RepID=UPI0004F607B3|nr:hypothetical protein KQ51_00608 [Candidatus Izimaplasma bacterium HR1]